MSLNKVIVNTKWSNIPGLHLSGIEYHSKEGSREQDIFYSTENHLISARQGVIMSLLWLRFPACSRVYLTSLNVHLLSAGWWDKALCLTTATGIQSLTTCLHLTLGPGHCSAYSWPLSPGLWNLEWLRPPDLFCNSVDWIETAAVMLLLSTSDAYRVTLLMKVIINKIWITLHWCWFGGRLRL